MSKYDILQYRIIRELMGPLRVRKSKRMSYIELSRKVGGSQETARRTLREMQESGIIRSWNATVNPHILGMECVNILVTFDPDIDTAETLKRLSLLDGVIRVFTFVDISEFRILLYYSGKIDLDRKSRMISSLCGKNSRITLWDAEFPPCRMNAKKIDWLIIKELMLNSRKTIPEFAKLLKVSSRTVRRRLTQLEDDNSYLIYPTIDPRKINGFIYLLFLSFNDIDKKREAELSLSSEIEQLVMIDTSSSTNTIIDVISTNVDELDQILKKIENTPGVTDFKVRLLMDVVPAFEWILNVVIRRSKEFDKIGFL